MSLTELLNTAGDKIDTILYFRLFDLNQTPVTVMSIIMFVFVFLLFAFASRIVNRGVVRRLLERMHVEQSLRFTIMRINHYIILIIGAVVATQFVGISLGGLAVIFGLLSVGIGFGLQNVTSNFVSGIMLLFERPITIGDRVTVGDTEGDVVAIGLRATTIRSLNNIGIIVPNSEFISSNVVNWSHGDPKIRLDLPVGVSYNSELDIVIKALLEAAAEHAEVLQNPRADVLLDGFGDSAWNMRLRVWIAHPEKVYVTRSEINCSIVRKFRKHGVEIPFPQRDLHVRSPLPVPVAGNTG